MRQLAVFMIIVLMIQYPICSYAAETEEEKLDLYAQSAVLMDADSGRVLYEKNGTEEMPMASTTKIMTLIVTLENAEVSDTVTVSKYAASMPDVQLNIREGEQYKLKDLLYSLMLESHNDSAVAIAEHVAGDVEKFAKLMNQKARDIGCKNTNFVTPNGLDRTDANGRIHATTAEDLSRIMSYCIEKSPKKEEFLSITGTPDYSFSDTEGKRSFSCRNHNAFLTMMEGALSGKTGFTGAAGYCYVGALERENKTFVVSLLACGWPNHKTYKWSDTKKLMEYGLEKFEVRDFEKLKPDEKKLQPILVHNGQTAKIGETAFAEVKVREAGSESLKSMLMRPEEQIEIRYEIEKELQAPVKKGEQVGTISYLVEDQVVRMQLVSAAAAIEKINLRWCITQTARKMMI